MKPGAARFIDDVRRYPVDDLARRVTAKGPEWCAPAERPIVHGPKLRPRLLRAAGPDVRFSGQVLALFNAMPGPTRTQFMAVVRDLGMGRSATIALARMMLGRPVRPFHAGKLEKFLQKRIRS